VPADFAPISVPPEVHPAFRRGQLLVLLENFEQSVPLERVGYLEFFAANPFLILREDSRERTRLLLAGFNPIALSYQAAAERYANRRTRLRSDLGALTAWGYAEVAAQDGHVACRLTSEGRERARRLTSLYADAYRASLRLIWPVFGRVSDTALAAKVREWLNTDDFHIDLWDFDVASDDKSPSPATS
jgi:hypothetical protein